MHLMKGGYDLEIDWKAVDDNDSYKQLQERAWRKRAAFPFIREIELSRLGQTAIHCQAEIFHQDKSFCSNKARLYNKRFSHCIEKDHYYNEHLWDFEKNKPFQVLAIFFSTDPENSLRSCSSNFPGNNQEERTEIKINMSVYIFLSHMEDNQNNDISHAELETFC